ncbi:uncharacterized protein LOC34621332 [Cyclospora cayetanensis]|uniref:Uncharacterized protein LOC34621332 n=1 Tax=Cyclospora cayetanensis TaxID=88456 RepID=A0A6P6RX15_9EIME|nr:uncharacterized protein LOC34621332 [Cyclospora cayetanensis]
MRTDFVLQCGVDEATPSPQGAAAGKEGGSLGATGATASRTSVSLDTSPPATTPCCTAACGEPPPTVRLPEGIAEFLDLLRETAARGAPLYPWSLFKLILGGRLYELFTALGKKQQRHLRSFDWERARDTLFAQVLAFEAPPLTLQRLCEIAWKPPHQQLEKLFFALKKLVRVRDGCTEWPSLPAIPTDEAFKRRLAAANAVSQPLSSVLRVASRGGASSSAGCGEAARCGCPCCVDWLSELLEQQQQQQQQHSRYSSEGPLETETEGEADASSAAAQEEAGGSQEEGGRCQTAVFAHGDKCNGGGASRKRNSEEVCIAEAPGATDTEADLPAAPRKRRVDGGQFIESSGNTEGDGAAKGQDAP